MIRPRECVGCQWVVTSSGKFTGARFEKPPPRKGKAGACDLSPSAPRVRNARSERCLSVLIAIWIYVQYLHSP